MTNKNTDELLALLGRASVLIESGTSNSLTPEERVAWKARQQAWLSDTKEVME